MQDVEATVDPWKASARCRGVDPTMMFPDDEDFAGVSRAKALCATCPVQGECLEYALRVREKDGVWGGLTARERQRVIRRRRREAA